MIHESVLVHPAAYVADSDVGKNSVIWQFASVIRGAVVGDGVTIGSGACVDGARLGDRSILSANACIFPGHVVGADCFIGPGAVLCNDHWPRALKAGFSGFIPAVAMKEDLHKQQACIVVEDGASIGANATILRIMS